MIVGAFIGAGFGAAISIATQAASGKGVNWGDVGKSAAVGAVAGAISGLAGPAGPITKAAIGGLAGAAGQVVSNALDHKPLGDGVLVAAGLGVASELGISAAGALAKGGGKFLGGVLKNAGKALCGGESFSADTLVATPDGPLQISHVKEGNKVQAYDPVTKQVTAQTVEHVWVNHDADLLDLTLTASSDTATTSQDLKQQQTDVKSYSAQTPPAETVHTTFSHPWLTIDRGWIDAGNLRLGEQVQRLDGTTATVTQVILIPSAQDMYDLTVSNLHTFAVGDEQFVVHNCATAAGLLKKIENARIQFGPDKGPNLGGFVIRDSNGNSVAGGNLLRGFGRFSDGMHTEQQALNGIIGFFKGGSRAGHFSIDVFTELRPCQEGCQNLIRGINRQFENDISAAASPNATFSLRVFSKGGRIAGNGWSRYH